MMTIEQRMRYWKRLAQTAAPAAGATPTPTTTPTAAHINMTQVPTFKPDLFRAYPPFIQFLEKIINLINKHLVALSNGAVNFTLTWTAPSTGASRFSNSLKNLFALSKWLYGAISINGAPYDKAGLIKIANDLVKTVNGYDLPEIEATNVKSDIVAATQIIINEMGK
jgi:hypothetical protein